MNVSEETENRILEKAEYVEEAVTVLAQKQSLDKESYRTDREERAIVEREFQTAIEACIDIAKLLIAETEREIPDTNAEQFATLGGLGLISEETSQRMQKAAGFRNILTHSYGPDIDDTEVYQHLQNELTWIVKYLREVRDCLDNE